MRGEFFVYSVAAAVALLLIVSFLGVENFAAMLLAVFVHEMGHLAALRLMRMRIRGVHPELCGLRIDYDGSTSPMKDSAAALAGPLAGVLFYFIFENSPGLWGKTAELGLLYSAFNLLPISPLDGGYIIRAAAELISDTQTALGFCKQLSGALAGLILFAGFVLLVKGEGGALFAVGIWLLLLQS